MPEIRNPSRWRIILRAWPPAGAAFVALSFLVTAFWLWHAVFDQPASELNWLEPLAAILAGTGAFILAAILIFRRVDCARAETDTYSLARGLATGYYFNFVRPLIGALREADHPLHSQVRRMDGRQLVGMVVGLPESLEDFAPTRHAALLQTLSQGPGRTFTVEDIEVSITGRPRPIFTKLALSDGGKAAIIVDIPTTLTVIADFAQFFAEKDLGGAPMADEAMVEARTDIVAAAQTAQFREVLTEFLDVVNKVGALESRELSPTTLLHVVPLRRLRRRLDELADH